MTRDTPQPWLWPDDAYEPMTAAELIEARLATISRGVWGRNAGREQTIRSAYLCDDESGA